MHLSAGEIPNYPDHIDRDSFQESFFRTRHSPFREWKMGYRE